MIDENRIFEIEEQTVGVKDFPAEGLVLDIGGGGEGVIGQLKGAQVVAIDQSARELEQAPDGPLKIVMDASELKFLEASFNTVTSFFAFMFIPPNDHSKVFQEILRVLKPGGQFLLWDVDIQPRPDLRRDLFVFHLQVNLPETVINTGYGTPYTETPTRLDNYISLAKETGFELLEQSRAGKTFFCRMQKAGQLAQSDKFFRMENP